MNLVKCISSKNDRNQIKQGYNSILAAKINQKQDTGHNSQLYLSRLWQSNTAPKYKPKSYGVSTLHNW